MWLNLAAGALLFTEGLGEVMTGFTSFLGPWAIPLSFGLAIANVALRSITETAVTL